jgi:hypothetical protein
MALGRCAEIRQPCGGCGKTALVRQFDPPHAEFCMACGRETPLPEQRARFDVPKLVVPAASRARRAGEGG